ncbi:MAG: selenium metabolism-associated LysR family transcriptional regulator [Desulfosarcinaceae bacterium]|nr:selenium metabolism-associated LysR family transcriptional regulator [Desulfosarcinaceae bacterium]
MNLWQLEVFCKVVELGSFSKAGQAIHLSQPTVSSHIKDIETHFDTQLIDRLTKRAIPTKAGELLYAYAKRLIRLREETEQAMAEFLGKRRGHLHIGGSTIPGGYLLPPAMAVFGRKYPEVKLSLVIEDTAATIEAVASGQIELGIVGAKSSAGYLRQRKLLDDEMRLIVPASHRWASLGTVGPEELKAEPFLMREAGSGTRKSLQLSLQSAGIEIGELNICAEMGSTEAIRQGIQHGAGISILSPIAVQSEINSGILAALRVEGLDLKRSFYLTWDKERTLSPLAAAFSAFLKRYLHRGSTAHT